MKTRTANIYFIISLVLLVSVFFFFWVKASHAIEWHTADNVRIAWDADTEIKAPDVLAYGVYTKMLPNGPPVFVKEVEMPTVVIQFTTEGRYVVGISTIRYIDKGAADEVRLESEVNWSDVNGVSTPNPFGASYYIIPNPPSNLHKQ